VRYFETIFLEEADEFIAGLDQKSARKVFYNIDLAEQLNDPKLFKKLKGEIWSSGQSMVAAKYAYLPFGTKQKRQRPLF